MTLKSEYIHFLPCSSFEFGSLGAFGSSSSSSLSTSYNLRARTPSPNSYAYTEKVQNRYISISSFDKQPLCNENHVLLEHEI